jgi:hypothetical protein
MIAGKSRGRNKALKDFMDVMYNERNKKKIFF